MENKDIELKFDDLYKESSINRKEIDRRIDNLNKEIGEIRNDFKLTNQFLTQKLTSIDENLRDMHDSFKKNESRFWGNNGEDGIFIRIDRLEQDFKKLREERKQDKENIKWLLRLVIGSIITLLLVTGFNHFQDEDSNPRIEEVSQQ